jgi:hypothetical protein
MKAYKLDSNQSEAYLRAQKNIEYYQAQLHCATVELHRNFQALQDAVAKIGAANSIFQPEASDDGTQIIGYAVSTMVAIPKRKHIDLDGDNLVTVQKYKKDLAHFIEQKEIEESNIDHYKQMKQQLVDDILFVQKMGNGWNGLQIEVDNNDVVFLRIALTLHTFEV